MTALRVAIYARVSSEQQASDNTIASQIAALEARLAQDGFTLTPDERFTERATAGPRWCGPPSSIARSRGGGQPRSSLRAFPDRLARHYAYQVLLIEEIRRAGVEIVFLNRPIGLSPEDDLLLQVQGMVAEYERAKILERSRRGKRHAARQGRSASSRGALGYRYIGKRDGGGVARYEILEERGSDRPAGLPLDRPGARQHWRDVSASPAGGLLTRWQGAWDRRPCGGCSGTPPNRHGGLRQDADRTMPARLRPVRGGSEQPRRAHGVYNVAPSEWIGVPVPPLVDEALFEAVREQLEQNQRRNRQQARGQRYLLQGLRLPAVRLCLLRQGHQPEFGQGQAARLRLLSLLRQRRLPFWWGAPMLKPAGAHGSAGRSGVAGGRAGLAGSKLDRSGTRAARGSGP